MARFEIPKSPDRSILAINELRGVDLSNAPANVEDYRSPDAPNMIRDQPGKVRKRMGYERMDSYDGRINGVFYLTDDNGTREVVHAGNRLYVDHAAVYEEMADTRSAAWQFGKKLYLLDGRRYLVYGELDEMQEGYDKILEHVVWKNQFVVTREMIDDAKLLSLKKKPQGFVTSYYRTREQFAAALLAGGIGKSVSFKGREFPTTGADGKPLFDAQHPPKVKGAKQANKFTDAFSGDALSKMETAMQNVRDDNDNVLAVAPNTIVIPNLWKLKKQVFETIGADKDPATANNGFNYQFGRWNVIVWAYLNQYITKDAAPWILMDSGYNEENGGALWINRVPLEVRSWVDNNNDNNVWNGYARFIAGFADWRFAAIGGVADGVALPG